MVVDGTLRWNYYLTANKVGLTLMGMSLVLQAFANELDSLTKIAIPKNSTATCLCRHNVTVVSVINGKKRNSVTTIYWSSMMKVQYMSLSVLSHSTTKMEPWIQSLVDELRYFYYVDHLKCLMMNCCVFSPKAETLYFRDELQPWATRTAVCFSVTNFSAAPALSSRLKEMNAAAADSFKGR